MSSRALPIPVFSSIDEFGALCIEWFKGDNKISFYYDPDDETIMLVNTTDSSQVHSSDLSDLLKWLNE